MVDPETGFAYLRARTYDPVTGRFIERDSFGGFRSSPTSLNRYVYAQNAPTTHRDPSGRCGTICLGAVVGAAFGAGTYLLTTALSPSQQFTWQGLLINTAVGGLAGAAAGAGQVYLSQSIWTQAAVGGVLGGAADLASNAINGTTPSVGEFVTSVTTGALLNAGAATLAGTTMAPVTTAEQTFVAGISGTIGGFITAAGALVAPQPLWSATAAPAPSDAVLTPGDVYTTSYDDPTTTGATLDAGWGGGGEFLLF